MVQQTLVAMFYDLLKVVPQILCSVKQDNLCIFFLDWTSVGAFRYISHKIMRHIVRYIFPCKIFFIIMIIVMTRQQISKAFRYGKRNSTGIQTSMLVILLNTNMSVYLGFLNLKTNIITMEYNRF